MHEHIRTFYRFRLTTSAALLVSVFSLPLFAKPLSKKPVKGDWKSIVFAGDPPKSMSKPESKPVQKPATLRSPETRSAPGATKAIGPAAPIPPMEPYPEGALTAARKNELQEMRNAEENERRAILAHGEFEAKKEEARAEIARSAQAAEDFEIRKEEAEERIQLMQKELTALTERGAILRSEEALAREKYNEENERAGRLAQSIGESRARLRSLSADIAKLRGDVVALRVQNQKTERERADLSNQVDERLAKMESLKKEFNEVLASVENKKTEIQALRVPAAAEPAGVSENAPAEFEVEAKCDVHDEPQESSKIVVRLREGSRVRGKAGSDDWVTLFNSSGRVFYALKKCFSQPGVARK